MESTFRRLFAIMDQNHGWYAIGTIRFSCTKLCVRKKGEMIMRIGVSLEAVRPGSKSKKANVVAKRFTTGNYAAAQTLSNGMWRNTVGGRLQELETETSSGDRSEAEKIYEAAAAGTNPLANIRQTSKVPYGYLAKDGVITYNGVTFVCDVRTNSICLGDMTDKKKVLNIPLSGGGHLKVNRDNIGDLAKAIGMFSPEDVNLILRAIAQDTKIQSMQQELEDMENEVGESLDGNKE